MTTIAVITITARSTNTRAGSGTATSRGERIEVVHVERHYYVDDYEHYRLRRPPHGHRWIRTDDGKYLLVAVATGIIADILLHH